jgi:subtilase family serine protease
MENYQMRTCSSVSVPARLALGLSAVGLFSLSAFGQVSATVTAPAITQTGQNLGLESPGTPLTLTVWLNLHNRDAMDARVQALYTPGSPTFHQWLTNADLLTYAPTPAEVATVEQQMAANNLTVQAVDPLRMSIRFQGSTSDVESAFNTRISRYLMKGQMVHTTSSQPRMSGAAAGLVHHLSGLNSMQLKPMIKFPINPKTGLQYAGVPLASAGPDGLVYASECFYAPTSISLSGVSVSDGTPASAAYNGLAYGANPNNTLNGTQAPCGYSAAQVQVFYGMNTPYGLGYTGAGQTMVIIDSYLQPTALADLKAFSSLNHLPAPTASSFRVYNPYAAIGTGAENGTDVETDIDVEWAHAMAPGANIALLETFSEDEEDQQAGILYAATQHLGNVISLSYGYPEKYAGSLASDVFNQVVEVAAAEGIAFNASTGDYGDDSADGAGLGIDVDAPADSPYATAVGGTSIATSPTDGSIYTVGWGNNLGVLSYDQGTIFDPPQEEFYGGSGGGTSAYFAKPAYQTALPGTKRLMPDVSALADPFTGVEIVSTDATTGKQFVQVYGGTSVAAPIFSGMWAIVDEAAGVSLGQAAPYVAAAPGSIIKDILPMTGPDNVTGVITDGNGTTHYSSVALSQPLDTTNQFVSALWDVGGGEYINLTFGTDSTLNVTQGWDNVTGYGTPDMGALFSELGVPAKQ